MHACADMNSAEHELTDLDSDNFGKPVEVKRTIIQLVHELMTNFVHEYWN